MSMRRTMFYLGVGALLPFVAAAAPVANPAAPVAPAAVPAAPAPGGSAAGGNADYWAKTDVNRDGNINRAEYLANAEQRFKEMDANNDGAITREEMRTRNQKMRAQMRAQRQKRAPTAQN